MAENKQIKFHLPGLSFNYPINMLFLDLLSKKPEFFREGVTIGSFFGEFPTSLWNGGRFSSGVQCPKEMVQMVVKNINDHGIPVRYTFTNPIIFEEDLNDPYCNFCMSVGDNGMNEVMILSPILEKYIREKYPSYKHNSSTCKEIKDIDKLNEELKKDYYLVVLDQNLNRNFDFIDQIEDKARIELLVNSCCGPNCTRRAEHYRVISAQQRVVYANRAIHEGKNPAEVFNALPDYVKERLPEQAKNGKLPMDKSGHPVIPYPTWECRYGDFNTPFSVRGNMNYIPSEDVWEKYIPMGFTNFKIEGRTGNVFSIVENYVNYMCLPEAKDEARYTMLTQLKGQGILGINRTWWIRPAAPGRPKA